MKTKPLDRQSLLDIALQTGGGVEAALELSIKHDIAMSEPIASGAELETPVPVKKTVLARYGAQGVRPATELSPADTETAPYGGIGYMGIEIDFIVS